MIQSLKETLKKYIINMEPKLLMRIEELNSTVRKILIIYK